MLLQSSWLCTGTATALWQLSLMPLTRSCLFLSQVRRGTDDQQSESRCFYRACSFIAQSKRVICDTFQSGHEPLKKQSLVQVHCAPFFLSTLGKNGGQEKGSMIWDRYWYLANSPSRQTFPLLNSDREWMDSALIVVDFIGRQIFLWLLRGHKNSKQAMASAKNS